MMYLYLLMILNHALSNFTYQKHNLNIEMIAINGSQSLNLRSISKDLSEPKHKKLLSLNVNSFYVSKTEVTVAQYKKCVEAKACQAPLEFSYQHKNFAFEHCNYYLPNRDDHPMNCVHPNQANDFARWLGLSLPSYMQWSQIQRSEGNFKYPWGNQEITHDYAVIQEIDHIRNEEIQKTIREISSAINSYYHFTGKIPKELNHLLHPIHDLKPLLKEIPYDPWGSLFRYSIKDHSFRIYSLGPNKQNKIDDVDEKNPLIYHYSTMPVCSKVLGNSKQGVCDLIGNVSEILSDEVEDTDCNGRSCNQQYYIVGLSWKDRHRDKITILSQIDEGDDQSGFRVVLSMKD